MSLFLFCFLSLNSYANTLRIGLAASIYSKKLNGTQKSSGTEGKLISNSNLNTGLSISYPMISSLHFLLDYYSRTVDFDNTDQIITGEEKFKVDSTSVGLRWILIPRMAFRIMFTSEQDIAFDVNGLNQAVLYTESSSYLSVFYDQIIFLGASMYSGFRLGYDIGTSGETLSDRSASRGALFFNWGHLEGSYELKTITKSNSSLDFDESDSEFRLMYTVGF